MQIRNTTIKVIPADSSALDVDVIPGDSLSNVNEDSLRKAYRKALQKAGKLKLKKIALPVLGVAGGLFPVVGAAKILAQEILRFCRDHPDAVAEITVAVPERKSFQIIEKQVLGYLRHVIDDMGKGPYVTVDMIIELKEGLVLIERSNPPYGWALPGGFVDYGENLETAARREAREETHLELKNLRQFRAYSDPRRDPRFHTISVVFVGEGQGRPRFGDDAKGLQIIPYQDLLKRDYAFDHKKIIKDYLAQRRRGMSDG